MMRVLAYLDRQVGQLYVWGGNGEKATEARIRRMETSARNVRRALALFQKRTEEGKSPILCYDCSGLISRFLQNEGLVSRKRNSRHLYALCERVELSQLTPGDLVFRHDGRRVFHVGVYIGGGLVIESKGRDDGVVRRPIAASGKNYWNRAGRLLIG